MPNLILALCVFSFCASARADGTLDTLAMIAKGASLLGESQTDFSEWARADTASFRLIQSAAEAQHSRRIAAASSLFGGMAAFVAGFFISSAAGDCNDHTVGVECHNPAGAIVAVTGLVAMGVGSGLFFTDPPAVRTLRSTYFYHLMDKRMK